MDTGQRVPARALLESAEEPHAASRTAIWWTITICVYLAIACLAYWPVEPLSRSHLSYCACSDSVQETWFLAWPAYAIRHARNPFLTSYINAPGGVNLALNTSMPLLGIIAAPITWLRGPIAAFNFMMRLSFAASATSMTFVLRRFTKWWPASFIGGLVYGFSPYMVGQGNGHLFLTFVPLPPLIIYCVYRLVEPAVGTPEDIPLPGGARRWGLALGGLCVLQFLISIEVLVTTGVFVLIGLLIFLLRDPRRLLRSSTALVGVLWALALFVPLVAFPTWVFLRGPQHVIGPPHAVVGIAPFRSDLLGPIVPTANEIVGPSRLIAIGSSFALGDRPENGIYLGIPLLVLLGFLACRCRRQGVVLIAALAGLCALVLALGTPLTIDDHSTSVTLPFVGLTHVPLLQGVLALRFSLYVQLAASFVLGVGLDLMRREGVLGRVASWRPPLRPWLRPVAIAAIGALALIPLIPRYPYPSQPTMVPSYFTSQAVQRVPAGSLVLTYPYDIDPNNQAMLWQAASGMRFRIFGGEAAHPGPDGRTTSNVQTLQPAAVEKLFRAAMYKAGQPGWAPAPDPAVAAGAVKEFCARYGVQAVVADPIGADPQEAISVIAAALGAPQVIGGVDVWYLAGASDPPGAHP